MQRATRNVGVTVLAIVALGLLVWPAPIDPVADTPLALPPLTGDYEPNARLRELEQLPLGGALGPEDIAFDREGRIYTGVADGRVLRLEPDGGTPRTFANTGGRPLGLRFAADGNLIVADAVNGLLSVSPNGLVTVLTSGLGGAPFKLVDAAAVARDGTVYFTDATRFPIETYAYDALEHRPHGRLLSYDPRTKHTRVLLDGLYFANGVALSPDESFVLINETTAYRGGITT